MRAPLEQEAGDAAGPRDLAAAGGGGAAGDLRGHEAVEEVDPPGERGGARAGGAVRARRPRDDVGLLDPTPSAATLTSSSACSSSPRAVRVPKSPRPPVTADAWARARAGVSAPEVGARTAAGGEQQRGRRGRGASLLVHVRQNRRWGKPMLAGRPASIRAMEAAASSASAATRPSASSTPCAPGGGARRGGLDVRPRGARGRRLARAAALLLRHQGAAAGRGRAPRLRPAAGGARRGDRGRAHRQRLLAALVSSLEDLVERDPAFVALHFELFTSARRTPRSGPSSPRSPAHPRARGGAARGEGARGRISPAADAESVVTVLLSLADGLALRMLADPEHDWGPTLAAALPRPARCWADPPLSGIRLGRVGAGGWASTSVRTRRSPEKCGRGAPLRPPVARSRCGAQRAARRGRVLLRCAGAGGHRRLRPGRGL